MASGGSGHYFETPSETVPITEGDLVTQQELDVSAVEAVSSSGAAGLAQQKLLSLAESSAASETLSIQGPIGVISAEAFDPQWVRVLFSEDIDPTFAPFRDLSNYALNPAEADRKSRQVRVLQQPFGRLI